MRVRPEEKYRRTPLPPVMQALEPRRLMAAAAAGLPRYDHVVVVVEEDRDYAQILGGDALPRSLWPVLTPSALNQASYIRSLADKGASFTDFRAAPKPAEPAYFVMFSGSGQGVTANVAPRGRQFDAPSLGGQMRAAGLSFTGYAEGLPRVGFTGRKSGLYVARHAPWVAFKDVPAQSNRPFSDFPRDYSKLPHLSFVAPNLRHDMHSGTIAAADRWLKSNLGGYAKWARTHNSLLIVTFDEGRSGSRIPTIFYGAHVRRGEVARRTDFPALLRTIEDLFGLPALGAAAKATPATSAFSPPTTARAPAAVRLTPFSRRRIADHDVAPVWADPVPPE